MSERASERATERTRERERERESEPPGGLEVSANERASEQVRMLSLRGNCPFAA